MDSTFKSVRQIPEKLYSPHSLGSEGTQKKKKLNEKSFIAALFHCFGQFDLKVGQFDTEKKLERKHWSIGTDDRLTI